MSDKKKLEIVEVDRTDGVAMVAFSDDTLATYSAEELASIKPNRVKPESEPDEPDSIS